MPTGWLPEEVHVCRTCGLPTEENAMWQHCECPTEEEDEMPDLTPYDTGDRLEPHRWRERPTQPEDYGKVDFDDDESATVATVHIEKTPAGKYRLVIETDFEFEEVAFNGEARLPVDEVDGLTEEEKFDRGIRS